MEGDKLDDLYYDQLARIGQALDSASRLRLLDCLSYGKQSVEQLAEKTNLTVANASQHLQKLKDVRLVQAEKDGLKVYYRLAASEVGEFYQKLQKLADQRLFEVKSLLDQYQRDADALEEDDAKTLAEKARRGEVTVLDVRPRDEYEQQRLPGAVSVPLEELEKHLDELPDDQQIVAYCRGSYCVLSDKAASKLRQRGYNAHSLAEGVEEWEAEEDLELISGQ